MEPAVATHTTHAVRAPAFNRILCGIDGSPSALEAAAQAATLAARGGRIEFMAVSYETGHGPSAQSVLSHDRAEHALRDAKRVAAKIRDDIEVVSTLRKAPYAARTLIHEAAAHDLLVIASHRNSRAAGIMVGSTVSRAVHEAHAPVLVARQGPADVPFPSRILVGADGPGAPEAAIAMAAQVARGSGAQVTLLRVGGWRRSHQRVADEAAVHLAETPDLEPIEIEVSGAAHRKIVELAQRERVSLVVVGSRGLQGVRALASTSERVAHEAPCSVLVLRT